jgi:hypothetical protein
VNERQAQLEWEARAGKVAGALAFAAAALIILGIAYRIGAVPHDANNVKEFLPQVHKDKGTFLVSGVLSGLAMLAFIPPLWYLYRATRFRRPELPSIALILLIAGPVLFAVLQIIFQMKQADAAATFLNGTVKTNKHAEDVLRDATSVVAGLTLAASIAIGLATILISMNAMRAGLVSRFMGILGVILGGLFVLPLVAAPIIQLFWLTALGVLFINQWPGTTGRGPAWESGEAELWPTSQDRYAAAQDANGEDAVQAEDGEGEPAGERGSNPRAARKRKKKKSRR